MCFKRAVFLLRNFEQANNKSREVTDNEDDDNYGADLGQHHLAGFLDINERFNLIYLILPLIPDQITNS